MPRVKGHQPAAFEKPDWLPERWFFMGMLLMERDSGRFKNNTQTLAQLVMGGTGSGAYWVVIQGELPHVTHGPYYPLEAAQRAAVQLVQVFEVEQALRADRYLTATEVAESFALAMNQHIISLNPVKPK